MKNAVFKSNVRPLNGVQGGVGGLKWSGVCVVVDQTSGRNTNGGVILFDGSLELLLNKIRILFLFFLYSKLPEIKHLIASFNTHPLFFNRKIKLLL